MAEHWCVEHNTVFFKKGNMRGYAHPIKNANGVTVGWCNEPEHDAPPEAEHQPPPETDKRQASIEAQNALTNLSGLYDKLSPAEQFELVAVLCDRAGITFDSTFHSADRMPPMKSPGKPNG